MEIIEKVFHQENINNLYQLSKETNDIFKFFDNCSKYSLILKNIRDVVQYIEET